MTLGLMDSRCWGGSLLNADNFRVPGLSLFLPSQIKRPPYIGSSCSSSVRTFRVSVGHPFGSFTFTYISFHLPINSSISLNKKAIWR